jgi:Lsr2
LAKETITQLTDDLDGSEAIEEVAFAVRGVEYKIDLGAKNLAAFDKAFERFIKSARPVHQARAPRGRAKARSNGAAAKGDVGAMRAWAAEAGYEVSSRGRIPGAIRQAYEAAHG